VTAASNPSSGWPARGASVRVHDVFHVYRDGPVETVALRGLDLSVDPGEYVAIMGRSGSGKSTLLNLLAGGDRPTAGAVVVDDVDLAKADERVRARLRGRAIGSVFQADNLVGFLDLVENLRLAASLTGASLTEGQATAALERLGLGAVARRRPAQLSGGEQQRAALAMVLAIQPRLMLADEITGELDRATATVVLDAIDVVRGTVEMTLIVATHDAAVADRADRVAEIRDGRAATSRREATPKSPREPPRPVGVGG